MTFAETRTAIERAARDTANAQALVDALPPSRHARRTLNQRHQEANMSSIARHSNERQHEVPGSAPRDLYPRALATLRAAASIPAPNFEAGWKVERTRQLAAEAERINAHIAAYNDAHPTPRLTAAEVANFA